jgi:hypothetical protein
MKLIKLYESLLNEAAVTSCVAKFGYELFGQELGGREKDTPTETNYIDLINKFTRVEFGRKINPGFVTAIDNLKRCTSEYPDVLIPEKEKVYRGIMIPLRYFINTKSQILIDKPISYIYKASNMVQSWSTSKESASLFGFADSIFELYNEYIENGYNKSKSATYQFFEDIKTKHSDIKIPFILQYSTNKSEFLFKSKFLSILSFQVAENEVLRVDNKPIETLAYFNSNTEDFDYLPLEATQMLSDFSNYITM